MAVEATQALPALNGPLLAGHSDQVIIYDVGSQEYHKIHRLAEEPVSWSPDGCTLAYRGRDHRLYISSVQNPEPQVLIADRDWSNPVWSQHGEWIAYDTNSGWLSGQWESEVFAITPDGERFLQLTDDEDKDYVIGWMPDTLEVIIWSEDTTESNLYAVRVDTHTERLLSDLDFLNIVAPQPHLSVVPAPALLSPDGSRLRLTLVDAHGWHNSYWVGVLDLNTGEFWTLHNETYGEFGFSWSPEGDRVVFGARNFDQHSLDRASLYMQDVTTASVSVLNIKDFVSEGDAYPSWSPDASMLAIQGWSQPYIYHLETEESTLLDSNMFQSQALLWSPRLTYGEDACR